MYLYYARVNNMIPAKPPTKSCQTDPSSSTMSRWAKSRWGLPGEREVLAVPNDGAATLRRSCVDKVGAVCSMCKLLAAICRASAVRQEARFLARGSFVVFRARSKRI
jgi:hypothetical protein